MKHLLMNEKTFPLTLNLQFFSEEPDKSGGSEPDEPEEPSDKEAKTEEGGDGEELSGDTGREDGKLFTQAELEDIIAKRLKRERDKQEKEQERLKQEEQGEYKKLLDQEREDFRKYKREITVKDEMLKEGYDLSQVERYAKFIDGDEADEISESIAKLKEDVKPKSAEPTEPSPGPGKKKQQQQSDGREDSIERFKQLKAKGKIK